MDRYQRLKEIDFAKLWHPFTQHSVWFESDPLIIERGEGVELIDVAGRRYLDGVSSLWCNVHGHSVPELCSAIHEQAELICHSTLLGLSNVPVLELTEKLLAVVPPNLSRAFYSDSGSAAVEAAIRMALEWWQHQPLPTGRRKTRFVSLLEAYHGDTLGSVSLGFVEVFHRHLRSHIVPALSIEPPHTYRFYRRLSEADALAESLKAARALFEREGGTIAALVLEPLVQGAAGMWVHPPEFLVEMQHLCRRHDVLLVVDEVATGFGKTGTMFAINQATPQVTDQSKGGRQTVADHSAATSYNGIRPDIMTIGKGLSGGYLPISAALVTEELFNGFLGRPAEQRAFFYGQTFAGNPLAAKVASANLDLFATSGIMQQLPGRIAHFRRLLAEAIEPLPHVDEIRNCGLMTAIELTSEPGSRMPYAPDLKIGQQIVLAARARGAFIRPLGNAIILMPALAMNEEQLTRLVEITADAIGSVTG